MIARRICGNGFVWKFYTLCEKWIGTWSFDLSKAMHSRNNSLRNYLSTSQVCKTGIVGGIILVSWVVGSSFAGNPKIIILSASGISPSVSLYIGGCKQLTVRKLQSSAYAFDYFARCHFENSITREIRDPIFFLVNHNCRMYVTRFFCRSTSESRLPFSVSASKFHRYFC